MKNMDNERKRQQKSAALPFSKDELRVLAKAYPTPFHLYDEGRIRQTCRDFKDAFQWVSNESGGFTNFFAVKATPNPHILKIVQQEGFGFDCSSLAELLLAEAMGAKGADIMFTSNNTPLEEFKKAIELGAIVNLDDISHIAFIDEHIGLPKLLSFRYNPGPRRSGNVIIGEPAEAKFGLTQDQLFEAFRTARSLGVQKFGLHTMVISNCLNMEELTETATMLFELVVKLYEEEGIQLEFVNLGGGIGIPYKIDDTPVDIAELGRRVEAEYKRVIGPANYAPRVVYECGRYITGQAGCLVTRVLHQKNIYRKYIGVDASMANLMRPGMYKAYHHLTVVKDVDPPEGLPTTRSLFEPLKESSTVDVVGGLCENNDKFAMERVLEPVDIGDIVVISDTGAHGHSMGFNYNGKLRSAEYLKRLDGKVVEIRRKETYGDLFATLTWPTLRGENSSHRTLALKGLSTLLIGIVIGLCASKTFAKTQKS